jgi:hypothetical protein
MYQYSTGLNWSEVFLTGTFFCDSTTAQSFPLTPMDIMFAAVMALKAYSELAKSAFELAVKVL